MTLWQNLDMSDRIAAAQTTAANKNIEDRAVEKDWWVTAVLKALFSTSCSNYLLFKGGTSISKGWPIIERFSEDIDLSLGRQFFLDVMKLPYAAAGNNTQLKNLRKASRKYIHGTLFQRTLRTSFRYGHCRVYCRESDYSTHGRRS